MYASAYPSRFTDRTVTSYQTSKPPGELTKKQRQNAARRDAEKAANDEKERERMAALAKHKRELENERMKEQFKKR